MEFAGRKQNVPDGGCDHISFWSWCGAAIYQAKENFAKLKAMLSADKKLYAGCYFWDYGNSKPLTLQAMQYQLDLYENFTMTV